MAQNNATLVNGVTYAPGLVGEAFSLDGNVANFVEIPNDPSLNPANAFTVEGWFYIDPSAPGNDDGVSSLVAKTNGGVGDGGWFLWFQDSAAYTNALRFDILTWGSPAWPFAEANGLIPSAAWYHVAGVFDLAATAQATLYLNGLLVASSSSTISSILNNSRTVRIGASHWTDAYGGNDRLEGLADEVQFFDRALSAAEIAAIYTAGSEGQCKPCTAPPSNLVSWWKAEDNADDSIDGNHGTLQNGTTFAAGLDGQAFSFDGVDDYVDLGSAATLDLDDFTIEAWVFIDPATNIGERRVISRDDYTIEGADGREIYILKSSSQGNCGSNGEPYLMIIASGGGAGSVCGSGALAAGWHHLAGVRSGSSLSLFVDGASSGSAAGPLGTISPEAPLLFGNINPPQLIEPFAGLLDEARIYDRALTVQEIARIYACEVPIVFLDGFESGGTGAWSATVGGP